MQVGIAGLGRMGANIARRLMRSDHDCVVYDVAAERVSELESDGAAGAASLEELVSALAPPRTVWMMLPAAVVEDTVSALARLLAPGDALIDGGNRHYRDAIARSKALAPRGLHYLDVGTSGGVWGLERGYCQMIGGDAEAVAAARSDLRRAGAGGGGSGAGRRAATARPRPPSGAICTAGPAARATSSRWSTTASSTA